MSSRLDEIADLAIRGLGQEDLDGRRVLLHGGRFVDRLADEDVLAGLVPPKGTTPGRDARPVHEPNVPDPLELVVEQRERALGLGRRLDGPDRVVLVAEREPEDRDDRVADDLLDASRRATRTPPASR